MKTQISKIREILTRGVEEVIDKNHLRKRLLSGEKLRIKLGIDPTGSKIHLGRAIELWKLRAFQELGHRIVLIIGDFTARIGDASDKKAMRKPLSVDEIKNNMKGYIKQVGKILDMSRVELHYNSEWLSKIKMDELVSIAQHFTAQQMIQRRNFKERWEKGKPIGLHELYYPLFQGYDSVAIRADLEIGGFDQLFNLKIGRELQKLFHEPPQDIMILQMLFGLDGEKMSTSRGNVINILDKPDEMYGKIMSMGDSLIFDYFKLCTLEPIDKIEQLKVELEQREITAKDLKDRLARDIIALYYNKELADEAAREFNKVFRERKIPSRIKKVLINQHSLNIVDLLMKTSLVSTRSEARRLISQGGVRIRKGDESIPVNDWEESINVEKNMIVQVGKRKFVQIK